MKKRLLIPILFALVIGLTASSVPLLAQGQDPASVIQAAYTAVAENDIDTAMTYVADDMVLTIIPPPPGADGVFIGKEAIRAWWTGLAEDNGRTEFSNVTVSGNSAIWQASWRSDTFDSIGIGPAEFEGVNIAQNGLLKSATWIFTEDFLMRFERANRLAANEVLARRYMEELWSQGNINLIEELVHEDFVSYAFPEGGRGMLKEAIVGFHAENPGGHFDVDELIVTEDRILVRGGAVLIPEGADELQRVDTWLLSMRVEDGKIADRWIGFVPTAE